MATLYKRATPAQARILRAVEGAVKNASHAHPTYKIPESFARSVAKRAAGTLTAQWPDVLAARFDALSDQGESQITRARPRRADSWPRSGRGSSDPVPRRSPLPKLWKALAMQIRPLKEAGEHEKAATFVEVLKMIAALQVASSIPSNK